MAKYDESEFLIPSEEERAEQQQIEMMKRIARAEARRVQTGEAEEDLARDLELEQAGQAQRGPKSHGVVLKGILALLSGDVLVTISGAFASLVVIAAFFLVSILCQFWNYRESVHTEELSEEVSLLEERAIRLEEQVSRQCSHSSISEKLLERNLGLEDPMMPTVVIE